MCGIVGYVGPDEALPIVLEGLWRLSDGRLLVVHLDIEAVMGPKRIVGMTGTPYVTVLSRDLTQACVDGTIDVDRGSRPTFAVKRDRLFVLQQVVAQARLTASAVIRSFSIDDTKCRWVALSPAPTLVPGR